MKKFCLILICLVMAACEGEGLNAREVGALTGGAMGAGLGAIIGHETGHAGGGVAIGAAAGALGGGLIGENFHRQNRALADMDKRIEERDRMIADNARMIEELKRRGADARITSRGVVVNLPDVLFEFNRSDLRPDALRAIEEIAKIVERYPDRFIAVEGHADSVGTIAYNQRLSEQRAASVARELTANGVSNRRLRVMGFGESDPIATNTTPEGRARNRRVEVIIEN